MRTGVILLSLLFGSQTFVKLQAQATDLSRPIGRDSDQAGVTMKERLAAFAKRSKIQLADKFVDNLHVLLLIDTNATDIRGAVKHDEESIRRILKEAFVNSSVRVHIQLLDAERLTPETVIAKIQSLSVGANDALMVYYSGHGDVIVTDRQIGTTPNVRGPMPVFYSYHVLAFEHSPLARSNLRTAMEDKKARLCILMTDCCAPPRFESRARVNPDFKDLANLDTRSLNVDLVQKLFARHSGFFDASTGDALADQAVGGAFTQTFLAACCYQESTYTPQPRTRPPKELQGLKPAPVRIDRNRDHEIDWVELGDLWNSLLIDYTHAEQGSLISFY